MQQSAALTPVSRHVPSVQLTRLIVRYRACELTLHAALRRSMNVTYVTAAYAPSSCKTSRRSCLRPGGRAAHLVIPANNSITAALHAVDDLPRKPSSRLLQRSSDFFGERVAKFTIPKAQTRKTIIPLLRRATARLMFLFL